MATERTKTKCFCLVMVAEHLAKLSARLVRHGLSLFVFCRACEAAFVWVLGSSTLPRQPVIANKIKVADSTMSFMMRLFPVLTNSTITFYTMTLHVQFVIH